MTERGNRGVPLWECPKHGALWEGHELDAHGAGGCRLGAAPEPADYSVFELTAAEGRVLAMLGRGAYHLTGADVRTARRLEERGLCEVEDFGNVRRGGRVDGERWGVSLTDEGRRRLDRARAREREKEQCRTKTP